MIGSFMINYHFIPSILKYSQSREYILAMKILPSIPKDILRGKIRYLTTQKLKD